MRNLLSCTQAVLLPLKKTMEEPAKRVKLTQSWMGLWWSESPQTCHKKLTILTLRWKPEQQTAESKYERQCWTDGSSCFFPDESVRVGAKQKRAMRRYAFSMQRRELVMLSLEDERDKNLLDRSFSRLEACKCSHSMSFSLSCFCLPVSRSREIAGWTSIITLDRTIAGGMATKMGMSWSVKIPAIIIPTPNCDMRVTALLNWGPHTGHMVCRLLIFK